MNLLSSRLLCLKAESTQLPLLYHSVPNVSFDTLYSSACFVNSKADSRIINRQLLDLAEDDAEAFDRISNWMYTGKLRMSNQEGVYYMQYATVYAVAEKYRMVRLKNYVINQLIRKAQQWPFIPPMDVVKYVYSTTPPRCPLRKLLVALLVLTLHNSSVEIILSDALKEVPEFAADLATACCNTFSGDPTQVKFMGLVEDYYEKS